MAKIIYDIFDETLLNSSSYQYKISLLLSNVACTYLIYDNDRFLAYKSYALEAHNRDLFSIKDELELLLTTDKMLNLSFSEAKICVLTPTNALVPKELFSEDNPYIYLNTVSSTPAAEILKIDDCTQEIINVYLLKIDLSQFLQRIFPQAKITHLISNLIQKFSTHSQGIDNFSMFINFHQNQMQVLVFNHSELHFANNFDFRTASDVAYFSMLVIDQLKLDAETIELFLSGHISGNAELYNMIKLYVRKVNFVELAPSGYDKDSIFGIYPTHTFQDII